MPFARLCKVLVQGSRRPPLQPLAESRVTMRVWPTDLDLNLHMNNGRYLTLMDLGRWDLMMRTGVAPLARRERWMPLVAAATMRYRRSLDPFQRFDLVTRIAAWDERYWYIEQRFEREGREHATGWVKALLRGREGTIPTARILQAVGHREPSPPLPPGLREWAEGVAAPQKPQG